MTTDLQEAFREAARREFAMVPDEIELDYTFSPVFQRRMQRIIRAQVHGYWNMVNTVGKRIAIAAAIIVMLLTTAMAIKSIRDRVIKFFVEVYEEYFELRFGEEAKDDIDPTPRLMMQFTLTELPNGYEEIDRMEVDAIIWTHWRDKEGNSISLHQQPGTQEMTINQKEAELYSISHNGLTLLFGSTEDTNIFIWEQYDYIFTLTVHEGISMDWVLRMIDSISLV